MNLPDTIVEEMLNGLLHYEWCPENGGPDSTICDMDDCTACWMQYLKQHEIKAQPTPAEQSMVTFCEVK